MPRLWVSPPTTGLTPRLCARLPNGTESCLRRGLYGIGGSHAGSGPTLDRLGVRVHRPSTPLQQEGVPPFRQSSARYRSGQSYSRVPRADRHVRREERRWCPPASHCRRSEGQPPLPSATSRVLACHSRLRQERVRGGALRCPDSCHGRCLCLAPLRASDLDVTVQVVDGVTLHASTMVHPCWAVLHIELTWSLHLAQSLGEELSNAGWKHFRVAIFIFTKARSPSLARIRSVSSCRATRGHLMGLRAGLRHNQDRGQACWLLEALVGSRGFCDAGVSVLSTAAISSRPTAMRWRGRSGAKLPPSCSASAVSHRQASHRSKTDGASCSRTPV